MLTEATLADDLPGNGRTALRSCTSLPLASDAKSKVEMRRVSSSDAASSDDNYISMVIAELLDSERGYVRDLRDTTEGYLHYILECPEYGISLDQIQGLFGNIEDIFHFSRGFLECLERCRHDVTSIANCFIEMRNGFRIYADYCTNYPRSVKILPKISECPKIKELLYRRQKFLSHSLGIDAYLLKPIQRVLKYHLLLEKMLVKQEKASNAYNIVENALDSMTSLASEINEQKRRDECRERLRDLEKSSGEGGQGKRIDISLYGELLLEDSFRISGTKISRQVFLFEKVLLLAKQRISSGDGDPHLVVKSVIHCDNLMIIESIAKENKSFQVFPFDNHRATVTLQARTIDQKRNWCIQIKKIILDNFEIPKRAKDLLMKIGKINEKNDMTVNTLNKKKATHVTHTSLPPNPSNHLRRSSTSLIPDFSMLKNNRFSKSPPIRESDEKVSIKMVLTEIDYQDTEDGGSTDCSTTSSSHLEQRVEKAADQLIWMSRQHSVRKMVKEAERSTHGKQKRASEPLLMDGCEITPVKRTSMPPLPKLSPRNYLPNAVLNVVSNIYARLKNPKTGQEQEEPLYDNIPCRMKDKVETNHYDTVADCIKNGNGANLIDTNKDDSLNYGLNKPSKKMIGERYATRKPSRETQLTLPKRRVRKGRTGSIKDVKDKDSRVENVYTKEPKVEENNVDSGCIIYNDDSLASIDEDENLSDGDVCEYNEYSYEQDCYDVLEELDELEICDEIKENRDSAVFTDSETESFSEIILEISEEI